MVAIGVNVKTTQTRLGHVNPRMTLNIYAQATTRADREVGQTAFRAALKPDARSMRDEVAYGETAADTSDASISDFVGGASRNRTYDLSIISAAL